MYPGIFKILNLRKMKFVKLLLLIFVIMNCTPNTVQAQWYKKVGKELKRAGRKIDKARKKAGHKIDKERKRVGHKIDKERKRSQEKIIGTALDLVQSQQGKTVHEKNSKEVKVDFIDDEILTQDQDGNYYYTKANKENGVIVSYSSYYYHSESNSWKHGVGRGKNLKNEALESHQGHINSGGRVVPKQEKDKFLKRNRPE